MSPNEAQLRAALHHGEGDSPDVGALISHAVHVRRARQRRITSIVTSTTVLAVLAAGVGLLISLGGGSKNGGADSAAAGGGAATRAAQHAPGAPVAGGSAGGKAATLPPAASAPFRAEKAPARALRLACPSAPARYMLPGGGGIGAYGSTEQLFARSVAAMKICAYLDDAARTPPSTVLTAADAVQFASALEAASARMISPRNCPANTAFLGATLEVRAVSGDARPLKPVVITIGPCYTSQVTNGTAVRYLAGVPKPVRKLLDTAVRLSPQPGRPGNGSASS